MEKKEEKVIGKHRRNIRHMRFFRAHTALSKVVYVLKSLMAVTRYFVFEEREGVVKEKHNATFRPQKVLPH